MLCSGCYFFKHFINELYNALLKICAYVECDNSDCQVCALMLEYGILPT